MNLPGGAMARAIATPTHGHFLERPAAISGPAPLLVGFHGYAETATASMAQLVQLPGAERLHLCAAQGLHLFYRGRTGEVVASWMTRFGRELAIADNVAYVQNLLADFGARHAWDGRVAYLGFSQGVAMAFRAAAFTGTPAAGVIALAADVPPELASEGLPGFPPVLLARGDADPGYGPAQMDRDLAVLRRQGVAVEPFTFSGGHEWTAAFREKAAAFLARVMA